MLVRLHHYTALGEEQRIKSDNACSSDPPCRRAARSGPALPAPAPGAVVVSKSAEVEGSAGLPSKIPTGITVLHAVYNRSHAVIRVIVVTYFLQRLFSIVCTVLTSAVP